MSQLGELEQLKDGCPYATCYRRTAECEDPAHAYGCDSRQWAASCETLGTRPYIDRRLTERYKGRKTYQAVPVNPHKKGGGAFVGLPYGSAPCRYSSAYGYKLGCRCDGCVNARREAERRSYHKNNHKQPKSVDAAGLVVELKTLHNNGVTWSDIGKQAGVPASSVSQIVARGTGAPKNIDKLGEWLKGAKR